jgi:hypothetical protein
VDQETFEFVSMIMKKHGLAYRLKDSKVPEDFSSLSSWFFTAFFILELQKTLDSSLEELKTLNSKFNSIYLQHQDLQKNILKITEELEQCSEIQEKCQVIKKKLLKKQLKKEEVVASELSICDTMLKNLKNKEKKQKKETFSGTLGDSFLASHCYSPDPKILEYKEYCEDSFIELPTQKGNTFENSITDSTDYKKPKKSAKKRCCGLRL